MGAPVVGQKAKRLQSVDVLRAVTMLLMIFVNDLSSVHHTPHWIEHTEALEDGLGFADTIFPVFLFIVGLSIPLAINARIDRGDSFFSIAAYILTRSFALIVMGFFHVNLESYNSTAFLPEQVWVLLITLAFFLIWLDYPDSFPKIKRRILIATGVVILLLMAFVFKGGSPEEPDSLMVSWWGILGTIGWSYLISAGAYLITKGKLFWQIIALLLFVSFNICIHATGSDFRFWTIGDGSSGSLTMFGLVFSLIYAQLIRTDNYKLLWKVFTSAGIIMILAGLIIRPYTEGVSKINSTPVWVFICTGIGILMFELMIWLVDFKGRQNWFKAIRPAGTSTLTCYLIPYFMVAIFTLVHFKYPEVFNNGTGGIIRSFTVAFIVVFITGALEKRALRLKI